MKRNDQGMTFIEVLVSLFICVILYLGVSFYFFQQRSENINERASKKAIALLTSEVEYWQGKLSTRNITVRDMTGYTNNPYKVVKIDSTRNITSNIFLEPIRSIDLVETKINPDFFEITVKMEWTNLDSQKQEIKLQAVEINRI